MRKQGRSTSGETTVEGRIVRLFLRMVGAECGLYNPHTKEHPEGLESEPLYQANLNIVRNLLKDGWAAVDLEQHIVNRYNAGERTAMLLDIMPKKPEVHRINEEDNLLDEEESYVHPHLFIRGYPGYAVQGGTLLPVTRGTITQKEAFSLGDLVDYYFKQGRRADTPRQRSAAITQMRWLLSQATLDEILFAIDLAVETGQDVGVFDLSDFLPEARQQVFICEAREAE